MTGPIVLDVSVALTWCFADEATQASLDLLDLLKERAIVVPSLWHAELANALLQGERRGRIDEPAITAFSSLIRDLKPRTDHAPDQDGPHGLIQFARRHALTAYDAAYLELAFRIDATLATHDAALVRAAAALGVPTMPV